MADPASAQAAVDGCRPGTVAGCLARAHQLGIARLDAQLLLAHVLGCSRTWLLAHDDAPVPDMRTVESLWARRAAGEPLAYLVGEREFHGLALRVTPAVLVPRPDTETVVDWAIELLPREGRPRVADLGTGSGAIALALKHAVPDADMHACDQSLAALDVARDNGRRLGLAVAWHAGSWWQAFEPLGAGSGAFAFDLAVANPPYLAPDDPHLAALRHEPRGALVPANDTADGLSDLEALIRDAPAYLAPGGWLLLEHGFQQAPAVRERLTAAGFDRVQTRPDLAGRPRASGGCLTHR